MQIPNETNPLGVTGCFTITVKPGILGQSLSYAFTPYFDQHGYCTVLDWGDGQGSSGVSGEQLKHTYAQSGTYTIKIKGSCNKVQFGQLTVNNINTDDDLQWQQGYVQSYDPSLYKYAVLVSHTNGDWDQLGNLLDCDCMFQHCSNMQQDIKILPQQMVTANSMFYHCHKATLDIQQLPQSLLSAINMFGHCHEALLPITRLPQDMALCDYIFDNCYEAQLPLTNIPNNAINCRAMFQRCYKALLYITQLPQNLQNGIAMFFSCNKANLNIAQLPDTLQYCKQMFRNCYKAQIPIVKLPQMIYQAEGMFRQCSNLELDITQLASNAPTGGYPAVDIDTMFYHSPGVIGSRSAFLTACPNATHSYTFEGTNTTE